MGVVRLCEIIDPDVLGGEVWPLFILRCKYLPSIAKTVWLKKCRRLKILL